MTKNLTLILGGASSGKSKVAETWVKSQSDRPHYIATAQAFDQEMRDKIQAHKIARGPNWETHEAPLDLSGVIASIHDRSILIDCVTLWLSNLLLGGHNIQTKVATLIHRLETCPRPVTLVSNEVGYGIVPDTALGRKFRTIQGQTNQQLAAICNNVTLVAAGLPLTLKGDAI